MQSRGAGSFWEPGEGLQKRRALSYTLARTPSSSTAKEELEYQRHDASISKGRVIYVCLDRVRLG